jgi:hypothetical protein
LTAFKLINVNSSCWDFVEVTSNCVATLVCFPGSEMGFAHDTAHAFGRFCLASCGAEIDVALCIQFEDLLKRTVTKSIVPVEQFKLACC